MPSPRDIARVQALGRVVLGGALTATPGLATRAWIGPRDAARTGTAVVATGMGARDLGLGLGTARAVGAGFGAKPWLAAGVLADAADCVATWRHRDELPAVGAAGIIALAGGSALLGLYLRGALD